MTLDINFQGIKGNMSSAYQEAIAPVIKEWMGRMVTILQRNPCVAVISLLAFNTICSQLCIKAIKEYATWRESNFTLAELLLGIGLSSTLTTAAGVALKTAAHLPIRQRETAIISCAAFCLNFGAWLLTIK